MRNFNNYLLTHYPLLWNTRAVWVLLANLIIHICFFIAGFSNIHVENIQDYYGITSYGGSPLVSLNVMISLLILIVWLIFYLRNNAFKNKLRIGRWYMIKEWALMLILVFTTISYSFSFYEGAVTRIKIITPEAQLEREIDAANRALAFVPQDVSDYFILNRTSNGEAVVVTHPYLKEGYTYDDSLRAKYDSARKDPFQLSYLNYSRSIEEPRNIGSIKAANDALIKSHNKDSIRYLIQELLNLSKKYNIDGKLNTTGLADSVFLDSVFIPVAMVPTSSEEWVSTAYIGHPYYFEKSKLQRTLSNVREAHQFGQTRGLFGAIFLIITVSFCSLLFLYRRLSRKTFLFGIIGSLVWLTLCGLLSIPVSQHNGFVVMLCLLFLLFTVLSFSSISGKLFKGLFIFWHMIIAPFVCLMILGIVANAVHEGYYRMNNERFPLEHPFLNWVEENSMIVVCISVSVGIIYIAVMGNLLTRKLISQPEE